MTTRHEVDVATAAVTKARADLDELLRIERLLETELPTARALLQVSEKQLRELTRPSAAAIREAELQLLHSKITEANQNGECSHV
ncbi:hypothetical protein ACYZT8_20360 [Pseudomonas sp. LB3P93]